MCNIYYLAGLPRSGSTLLSNLLNQHPGITITPTSASIEMIGGLVEARMNNKSEIDQDPNNHRLYAMIKGLMLARHPSNLTIDKSRGWAEPRIIDLMNNAMGDKIKIIATVRPMDECMASLVAICKPRDTRDFILNSPEADLLRRSYLALRDGYSIFPDQFLFINYSDLISSTQSQLDRVYDFLGVEKIINTLTGLANLVSENDDDVWGTPGLHTLKPEIIKTNRDVKSVLGRSWEEYTDLDFWNGTIKQPVIKELDRQLQLSIKGDFTASKALLDTIIKNDPECDRATFNAGWFAMRDGNLQEAGRLLDRGRVEGIFAGKILSNMDVNTDLRGKTVLLFGEGGFGDEIINVRFAKAIHDRGGKCVVACSEELASLFARNDYVSAVVSKDSKVHADYFLPGMSSPWHTTHDYSGILGNQYLVAHPDYIKKWTQHRGKIGLCYQGNPQFEHEQHRIFPRDLLDKAIYRHNTVSLQYGENRDIQSWGDTAGIIANLDLVITSCTAVAHLSGALGIPTWVVIPILPYYIWAYQGNKSQWYDSVTLFRQEIFGDWSAPFKAIRKKLNES